MLTETPFAWYQRGIRTDYSYGSFMAVRCRCESVLMFIWQKWLHGAAVPIFIRLSFFYKVCINSISCSRVLNAWAIWPPLAQVSSGGFIGGFYLHYVRKSWPQLISRIHSIASASWLKRNEEDLKTNRRDFSKKFLPPDFIPNNSQSSGCTGYSLKADSKSVFAILFLIPRLEWLQLQGQSWYN